MELFERVKQLHTRPAFFTHLTRRVSFRSAPQKDELCLVLLDA